MQATGAGDARQARPLFRAPDVLTALRFPLAAAFLLVPGLWWRLGFVAAAAITDNLDGFWARRIGGSRAGAVLDPVVDKVFVVAAFYVVLRAGVLDPIELVAVLLREIVALLAFLGALVLGRPTTLPARAGGKAVTVAQFLTLVAFLAGSDLLRPLAWATAAITLYAIVDYVQAARHRSSV